MSGQSARVTPSPTLNSQRPSSAPVQTPLFPERIPHKTGQYNISVAGIVHQLHIFKLAGSADLRQKAPTAPSLSSRMQGDVQQVVPNSYAEGGIKQLASSSGQAYQGFLPAMEQSSRSPDNLHSPPEPAGSSYSRSVFASVSH
jgi:hypothetical protein